MSTAAARSGLYLVEQRPPGPGLTDFALWLRANGCRETTIEDRVSHLVDFSRSNPSFPHVRPMQVSAWIGRPGYAPWTRATYFGHLRSYFTFALENDVLAVDPMGRMRRPKAPRGVPRPLTEAQVDLLLSTARPNMRTRLILGLFAGLRAHEIAKLRGEDVTERDIFVLGKGGQTDSIPTHPRIWAEAQSRPEVGWWFPSNTALGHVTKLAVSTSASRHFTSNGIEGSIHRTRHTYGTELLRAGTNVRVVQSLMRHASLESTMIYTAVDEVERLDGIARLGARTVGRYFAPKATHCDHGHEFTQANTYVTPAGHRQCRICRQVRQGRYYARLARTNGGPQARATHCGRGHEFSEANTYTTPAGRRQCRTCRQATKARYKARRRGSPFALRNPDDIEPTPVLDVGAQPYGRDNPISAEGATYEQAHLVGRAGHDQP